MNLTKLALPRLTAAVLTAAMMLTPALAATGTVTADGGLNVRQGSSVDTPTLGRLAKGTQVEILSDPGNGWLEISYQDTSAFVSGEYVQQSRPAGKVKEGPLNVRSAPGTDSARVGQLVSGTRVEVLKECGDWYEVEGGGLTGYVSAQYILLDSEAAQLTYIKVEEGPLNIRSGPGADYAKTGSLRTGRVVETYGLENGWYKVAEGYVCADYVRTADASEAARSDLGSEIAQYALQFVGCKYRYGATGPSAFDCSGLTKYVYKQFGYTLNRTASAQLDNGVSVSRSELQPGDLVMFKKPGSNASRASHVGIYIGGDQFVHASSSSVGVIVSDINTSYYKTGFVGARRLV